MKESALAEKISKQWMKLPEQTQQALIAFKAQGKFDVQILKEVHQLGHYPRRFKKPAADRENVENCLAEQLTKRWSQLHNKTQEELERLQQDSRDKRTETQVADILERWSYNAPTPQ